MAVPSDQALLASLLPAWHALLQDWSASGRLSSAAQEALRLNGKPDSLKTLVSRWSAGVFGDLPPIVLLSANDISGAMGTYAISTGTINLSQDWLRTATPDQVNAVLTEELGHHLDGRLNAVDTVGDEWEYSARITRREKQRYENTRNTNSTRVRWSTQMVRWPDSTGIRATAPERTCSQWQAAKKFLQLMRTSDATTEECDLTRKEAGRLTA